MIEVLLDNNSDINSSQNVEIMSSICHPLHEYCFEGNFNKVELLLDRGADINMVNTDQHTPLHVASLAGKANIVELLLNRNADVDGVSITTGFDDDQINDPEILLKKYTCVNRNESRRQTSPLHYACMKGHEEIAKLLLDRGANFNSKNSDGNTALHVAIIHNHVHIVELLLSRGVGISITNDDSHSAIHIASFEGRYKTVELLLNNGIDIDTCTDRNSDTALILASSRGHFEIVKLLLDRGANIDKMNSLGQTALFLAVRGSDYKTVVLLLKEGAGKKHFFHTLKASIKRRNSIKSSLSA